MSVLHHLEDPMIITGSCTILHCRYGHLLAEEIKECYNALFYSLLELTWRIKN